MKTQTILEQIRRNAVALISLVVACTSLGYNTWRNEHSEDNRNHRWAAFETLSKLGQLQDLMYVNFYDCNLTLRGTVRTGWTIIDLIEDLSLVLEDDMLESVDDLRVVWRAESPKFDFEDVAACRAGVGGDGVTRARAVIQDKAVGLVEMKINAVREEAREVLKSLE
ncbi:MAG: hypothetical protein QNJ00_06085 [Woeseiaceae bacterium]|nr:hypothetical protein [Woeseiaceae bacterium]